MADFDEGEAEAIASNWVQNLRFRFARMGLNYHTDEIGGDDVLDRERKSAKRLEERVGKNRKAPSVEGKPKVNDLNFKRGGMLVTKSECIQSPDLFDQSALTSTRSEKSVLDLENLREKRLNFFQQPKSSHVSASKLSDINKFNSRTTAWKSSNLNGYDNNTLDKMSPKSEDDSLSLTPKHQNCLEELLGADKCQRFLSDEASETSRNRVFDHFNGKEVDDDSPVSKDALQVFPIEIDGEDYDMRNGNTQPEILLSNLDEDVSDSDSDFTLDDPISRHTSPRVEGSPWWGHIRHNSGGISPLAQSVSPPTPQISGALYHEFSCSEKEFTYEDSNLVKNGNNDVIRSEGHHRPRSLSNPSTARDCSELCGSSYLCCCANPNDSVDVVCDVSLSKQYVDVKVEYDSYDDDVTVNRWDNSIKPSLKNSKEYLHVNLLDKQFKKVNMSQDNLTDDSLKESYSSPNKTTHHIDEQYFDVCVCTECDEINRASSNWCSECGAVLTSSKPVSSKSINLQKETNQTAKLSKPNVASKLTESSKANKSRPSSSTKKSVSIPKADSDFENLQCLKNKPKHNGRRWEKSNLAWSTFKDSHLSKPPSTKSFKSYPRKNSVLKEAADVSRPRSTSCKNPAKRGKAEESHPVPGSLPRSYKFKEFKKKQGSSDHGVRNLSLKGIKAKEMKTKHISSKTDGSDPTEACHKKLQPYLYLPDEIILKIFCYLSHADLARCSCVCRQLQRISQDEVLWRTIVLRRHQNISDEFLVKIGEKKPVSLSMIKCHGNLVTSSGLRELFRHCAENLEELNFIGCNGGQLIGESILLHVGLRCNRLRSVDVSWSNVGDNGVEALVQNVERLECLCLNGCQAITDHSLKVVADKHGESLRTFEIFGCFNVSAAAIKRLGQKCPNLKTLNLGQCYKITSSDIGRLVSHLQSIVNLDLRGCKQARDACVRTIVKHCPHLVSLVLANCPLITDVAMSEIATNLSAVRCLDVCGCVKVTDHGVRALARSCNRLNSLDLSSTSITQKSVMLLANYCSQNLQSLKLSFCVDVTEDSVCRLVKHCKRMKTLHLYGCKRLRNVRALQQLNQSLKLEF